VFTAVGHRIVEELPARGELLLELENTQPPPRVTVAVEAVGFLPAYAEFEVPAGGAEARGAVELEPAALLVAHATLPEEGRVEIFPERFDDEAATWKLDARTRVHQGVTRPNGPQGTFVFQRIAPGLWRVVDKQSGITSQEVEVAPGDREAHVELDLGGAQWVAGRVDLPDEAELRRVRVVVEGSEAGASPDPFDRSGLRPRGVGLDGAAFRIRVPGDRTVRLVPWHPWLAPAADGVAEVREGRDGVVLRLVEGDHVVLPVPGIRSRELRVARYAGEPAGEPLELRTAPVEDGIARCVAPRGRWTLWIDPGSDVAPLLLRDVEVDGRTELPPVVFEPGSSVRVRLLLPAGQDPPRIALVARSAAAPEYVRQLTSRGEREVVLSGLGPGRFRVSYATLASWGAGETREIDCDGTSEVALELDLR
jgi:hypothetical protein